MLQLQQRVLQMVASHNLAISGHSKDDLIWYVAIRILGIVDSIELSAAF